MIGECTVREDPSFRRQGSEHIIPVVSRANILTLGIPFGISKSMDFFQEIIRTFVHLFLVFVS
jgi:hypothetical protein